MLLRFVRHGETEWNRRGRVQGRLDVALNARGRDQAAAAARRLRGLTYGGLFTSSLSRAVETAREIARTLDLPDAEADPRLEERGFGAAEGMPWAHARATYPRGIAPDAERDDVFASRIREAVEAVSVRFPRDEQNVIVVGHGFAIMALMRLAGAPSLPAAGSIPNGSIVDFLVRSGRIEMADSRPNAGRTSSY